MYNFEIKRLFPPATVVWYSHENVPANGMSVWKGREETAPHESLIPVLFHEAATTAQLDVRDFERRLVWQE